MDRKKNIFCHPEINTVNRMDFYFKSTILIMTVKYLFKLLKYNQSVYLCIVYAEIINIYLFFILFKSFNDLFEKIFIL